jgi:hypothetical protein
MMEHPAIFKNFALVYRGTVAAALALCLGAGANAGPQDQGSGQPQEQSQGQAQDKQGSPEQPQLPQNPKPKPRYAPQDADKPPYSQDRARKSSAEGQAQRDPSAESTQPAPSDHGNQQAPSDRPNQRDRSAESIQPAPSVPAMLMVPAGTILMVRINEFLSSDRNQIGDEFTAVLEQPVVVNGWVVARRGQTVLGKVKEAKRAGRVKGVSQLGVELTDLTVVDGRQVPILTGLWKASAGTSHGQDAATIGGTTALGAVIGSAADWGRGAAIGAGAGAAAGLAAVLLTRGRPTELEPETELSFRLEDAVKIDTTQAQQAFLPVTQKDFDGGRGDHHRPRLAAGNPGPWGYPCGYYGPCYAYPAYLGIYSGYGWGPRYYGGYYGGPGFRH